MISPVLPPGSTVGIIGGGQLGRMTALAAATLGYKCHIFCPENESPASLISNAATIAPYDDQNSLEVFANTIDVATFEFENIPVETIKFLESKVPTHPNSKSLEISQDRLIEKKAAENRPVQLLTVHCAQRLREARPLGWRAAGDTLARSQRCCKDR